MTQDILQINAFLTIALINISNSIGSPSKLRLISLYLYDPDIFHRTQSVCRIFESLFRAFARGANCARENWNRILLFDILDHPDYLFDNIYI